jgi:hypothetical protein
MLILKSQAAKPLRNESRTRYSATSAGVPLLVIAALLLRALVPAGFMLAPVDGHLAFVLCDAEMSAGELRHHHHPGHDNAGHHQGVHGDPTCPYAQSAGPGPLPTLPVLASAATLNQLVAPGGATQTRLNCGPTRQQTPRGPPPFSPEV